MQPAQLHAPGIGDGALLFGGDFDQDRQRQCDHLFLLFFVLIGRIAGDFPFHVDRIGATNGDGVLLPAKCDLPGTAKGIWPSLESAEVFNHQVKANANWTG